MHLRPLLHLLPAQMPENSTSMTNVTAPPEGDHCSRAIARRFIKYVKTTRIPRAPLAQNTAEGRTSVRGNSQGGTEGWWAWERQCHCLPLPRDLCIPKESGFTSALGPWEASQPHWRVSKASGDKMPRGLQSPRVRGAGFVPHPRGVEAGAVGSL